MPIEVTMPKLSPTMESGRLVEWKVKVGDQVKEGDELADVETDKATMAMKSFEDGVVALLDVEVGDEIELGQRVMVLAEKGEDPKEVASQFEGQKQGAEKPKDEPKKPPEEKAEKAEDQEPQEDEEAEEATEGNGQDRRKQAAPAADRDAEPVAAEARPSGDGGRVKSSPLARKIAAEAGVDLQEIEPSGPGGRVIRRDVEAFLKEGRKAKAKPTPARPSPRPAAAVYETQRIPHSRMRKTIADRMLKAKQQAPEIHLTVEIRLDTLLAVRQRLNTQLEAEKIKLSVGDFVTKAVALALRRHPALNASFEPDAIVQHGDVNLGIAVALENGLIVPVLHHADQLGLREIRTGTVALAEAARQNKLSGEQLTGATFTISNLGMYGIRQFDAILNLPEVGILAVGSAEKRPVVEGDQLVVGTVMTVTLTADHRAVDGATAAEFLTTLKGLLEEPASMLL